MRTIDADALKKCAIPCQIHNGALTELCLPVYQIDNAPTVPNEYMRGYEAAEREYKRPQGEWVKDDYEGIHCSECFYIPLKDVVIKEHADGTKVKSGNFNLTQYCPNCGAEMQKV